MHDLAIAYFEWHPVVTYNRETYKFEHGKKGIDYIQTVGGDLYEPTEWINLALDYMQKNNLLDLFSQVKEYVRVNCLFVKPKELNQYAADCVLHESYKKWADFTYQEKLKL